MVLLAAGVPEQGRGIGVDVGVARVGVVAMR